MSERQSGVSPSVTSGTNFDILATCIEEKLGTQEVYNLRYRKQLEYYANTIPLAHLLMLVKGSAAKRSVAYFLTPAVDGGICLFEDLRLRLLEEKWQNQKAKEAKEWAKQDHSRLNGVTTLMDVLTPFIPTDTMTEKNS